MNTLGASFHVELQSGILQFLFYRADELLDILVACLLCGVQFLLDVIIGVVLQVFQRQVLQLAFQFIETQFVSQWRIEVGGFFADAVLGLLVVRVTYLAHQVHAIGNHDENHAHIFGKRQQ